MRAHRRGPPGGDDSASPDAGVDATRPTSQSISATVVKNWFQYRCERKARYEIMDAVALRAADIVPDQRQKSWAALGIDFEERVVGRLARETGVLRPGPGKERLGEAETGVFLRGGGSAEFAAQVNLRPRLHRPSFLADKNPLGLRPTYADLIGIDRRGDVPVFRVIDIKATRNARPFHKAQVAYYTRMLEAVLHDVGVQAEIDPFGEIWRVPDDATADGDRCTVERFPLAPFLRLVDEFCGETLPDLARRRVEPGRDETFFHLYFKCEQCEYVGHCLRSIRGELPPERRDLSATAGLSHESKRSLINLGIGSVGALSSAAGLSKSRQGGWTLQRRAERLVERAKALRDGRTHRIVGATTFLMPPRVDATLVLVVDHDPIENRLATLGYLRRGPDGHERRIARVIAGDRTPGAEVEALCEVLGAVVQDLTAIDEHNARTDADPAAAIHAHIIFFEVAEVLNLQAALGRHLQDPRVRSGLLHMVRMFPSDDLVPEPEFRGVHHLPATALRNVVEALYAVPSPVAYDLRGVTQALEAEGRLGSRYAPGPDFERPFSSLLSIDVMRSLEAQKPDGPSTADVEADVGARLAATYDLTRWLLGENAAATAAGDAPLLRLSKRPFRFQATFDPLAAEDLDVLQAFEILENRSGLLKTLVDLAQPARQRRDAGRCMADLRLLKAGRTSGRRRRWAQFEVPPESRASDLSAGSFDLVLTDDDPDALLNPALWGGISCRIEEGRPGGSPARMLVTMTETAWNGRLIAGMRERTGDGPWFVDRVFRDANTGRAADYLRHLADGERA